MIRFLYSPEVRKLFSGQEQRQSGSTSPGTRKTFEGQYSAEQQQRSEQLGSTGPKTGARFEEYIGQLMRAVAFAGATAAAAGTIKYGVGRFKGRAHAPRGGGGVGRLFQQPTFQPGGFSRKKRQSAGSGDSALETAEIGPL